MTVISLDSIVKNILLKRGYSIHWYIDFLVYCKDGLRELHLDNELFPIRYKLLPLDTSTYEVSLPSDYVDYTRVFVRYGQYCRPLVEDKSLDLIPNYDSNFQIQPYNEATLIDGTSQSTLFNSWYNPAWWLVNWNIFGENTGRIFGGLGTQYDTFRVNKSRNTLKINENLTAVDDIGIEYIGSGMDSDSATHIPIYAQMAIESFAMWQFYLHNRTYSQGEAELMHQRYASEVAIMRARLSDLDINNLKRIVQKNSIAIKY